MNSVPYSLEKGPELDKHSLASAVAWRDRCILCGDCENVETATSRSLCRDCESELRPRPDPSVSTRIPYVSRLFVAFSYEFPITFMHQSAKFRDDAAALRVLVKGFTEAVASFAMDVDVLIAVPLSRRRYIGRGFNQAYPLAQGLAVLTGKPVFAGCLSRVRHTLPQSLQPIQARENNQRGAFAVLQGALAGVRVGLVDDVVTTGATMGACAEALRQQGQSAEVVGFGLAGRF